MITQTILWKRLDQPGFESSQLISEPAGWRLVGTAVLIDDGKPCRLDYKIDCDTDWRTRSATVDGWLGNETVQIEITVNGAGEWSLNGQDHPELTGRIDVDLNFSPSTNLLPIRRLGLGVGQEAAVNAAWLRFPGFRLEPLDQVYRRRSAYVYQYESGGGRFTADLTVTAEGFVTEYPNLWGAAAVTTSE